VAGFDGDAGAYANGFVGLEEDGFEGEDVVAKIFAGMGNDREAGAWFEKFHAEHVLMVAGE
jgi:hypothetical protein